MLPNIRERRIIGPNAAASLRHRLQTKPPRTEEAVRRLAFDIGVTLHYSYRTWRGNWTGQMRPTGYSFSYDDEQTGESVHTETRRTLREAARDLLPDLVFVPADYPPTISVPAGTEALPRQCPRLPSVPTATSTSACARTVSLPFTGASSAQAKTSLFAQGPVSRHNRG